MNVNLAFTPNTHWTHVVNYGNLGEQHPDNLSLTIPPVMYRRIIYLRFGTDAASNAFLVHGYLRFSYNGKLTGEMPLSMTTSSNGGLQFNSGGTEDGMIAYAGVTPVSLTIPPQEFIVEANKVEWVKRSQQITVGGAVRPVWFFGCKSMHHW